MRQQVSIIVARATNNVIGLKGELPWYIPEDLKWFRSLTLNNVVVMGYNTYLSLGKPLSNRINLVVTNNHTVESDDVVTVRSLQEALDISATFWSDKEVFIIGGARLYQEALPIVSSIYQTLINKDYFGDVCFPEINHSEWAVVSNTPEFIKKDNLWVNFIHMKRRG